MWLCYEWIHVTRFLALHTQHSRYDQRLSHKDTNVRLKDIPLLGTSIGIKEIIVY